MFSYEEYYKLYNVPADAKYQEMVRYLKNHVAEMNGNGSKNFRDRMLQYSKTQAEYLLLLARIEELWHEDYLRSASKAELTENLHQVYYDITEGYDKSTANPQFAISIGGKELGPFLAAFAALFRQGAMDAFTHRRFLLLKLFDLYVELHKILLHGQVHKEALANLYRSYNSRTITDLYEVSFLQRYSPNEAGYTDIVMEGTLTEPYYLFGYGLPLGKNDFLMQQFCLGLPSELIEKISDALVLGFETGLSDGYRRGRRQLVGLSIIMGMERLARRVMEKLKEKGYNAYIYQAISSSMNPAYMWDHRCDRVSAVDPQIKQVLFDLAEKLCVDNRVLLQNYAGVIRIQPEERRSFRGHMGRGGRFGFGPTARLLDDTLRFQEIFDQMACLQGGFEASSSCTMLMPNLSDYVKEGLSDEEVLKAYKEAFQSYLDLLLIRPHAERPQQALADALDKGTSLYIKGRNGNETDLIFSLHELNNPKTESNFMTNSGGDYLPGGSVYTVPVLTDTNGLFHCKTIQLQGKTICDLRINIEDGVVSSYSYDTAASDPLAEGLLRTLLSGKEPLKVSEVCIGTNTEAYGKYVRFNEEGKNLIPEQMLSHLGTSIVIGDSRYEGSENRRYISPSTHKQLIALNGKMERVVLTDPVSAVEVPIEVTEEGESVEEQALARDTSILRELVQDETSTSLRTGKRTRFCIPFEDIAAVSMIKENGEKQDVIREGWFVLIGTDHLNLPLIEWKNELKERTEKTNE